MKEDFSRKLRRHKRLWKVIREEDKYCSRQQRFDRWYFFSETGAAHVLLQLGA